MCPLSCIQFFLTYCRLRTPASYSREWHEQRQLTQLQREHPVLSGLQSSHFSQSKIEYWFSCKLLIIYWVIFICYILYLEKIKMIYYQACYTVLCIHHSDTSLTHSQIFQGLISIYQYYMWPFEL